MSLYSIHIVNTLQLTRLIGVYLKGTEIRLLVWYNLSVSDKDQIENNTW